MVDVTVSRGSTSVTFTVLGEGGDLALARDLGKPEATFHDVGREDPTHRDDLSATDRFVLVGRLSSYNDAQTLAEDLFKKRTPEADTPLQLDLSQFPNHSGTYDIAPNEESALQITYNPGSKDNVEVQINVAVVGATVGGAAQPTQSITPDSGTGIKLERNGNSITFSSDQAVTRTVGRPGGDITPRNDDLPKYYDMNNPAFDEFEISTSRLTDSERDTLEETLIKPRLGTDTLTLHFLSNLWSLDAYECVPSGSQALRTAYMTGVTGYAEQPTLKLRVVNNS